MSWMYAGPGARAAHGLGCGSLCSVMSGLVSSPPPPELNQKEIHIIHLVWSWFREDWGTGEKRAARGMRRIPPFGTLPMLESTYPW
ncbi:hypothetical protein LZ31DRAFT_325948 [Colletotrichum somersetense]|nr:hypothetical protein LZ31DRAFT_325948 [Colletotrichum somersetense]